MRIRDVMTSEVKTIDPGASPEAARELMDRARIHHLVVAKGKTVLGVISSRDVQTDGAGAMVGDVMNGKCVTAAPDLPLKKAANLLRGRSIGCLPVVEDGRLVGIVTLADLLELVGRGVNPSLGGRLDRAPHKKVSRLARAVS